MTSRLNFHRLSAMTLAICSIVGAEACGSSTTSPSTNDTSLVTVNITGNVFAPGTITVTQGQSVNWKNNDNTTHTATSVSGPVTFNIPTISAMSAQGAPVVMTAKGTINYKCTIHGETGVIIVQ